MKKTELVKYYADELYNAQERKIPIKSIGKREPAFDTETAYEVQLYNVRRMLETSDRLSGMKIGLTSPAMQEQLGITEPDYGHLYASSARPDGRISISDLIQPKIEAELALVLKGDLGGPDVTAFDVMTATDYLVPAFEIIDSRITDWDISLTDTIADNASCGCYVIGSDRIPPDKLDLAEVEMQLYRIFEGKREQISQGKGTAVMGNPLIAAAWLANRLATYGQKLKTGDIILSGAFSGAFTAASGEYYEAKFSGIGWVKAEFI